MFIADNDFRILFLKCLKPQHSDFSYAVVFTINCFFAKLRYQNKFIVIIHTI